MATTQEEKKKELVNDEVGESAPGSGKIDPKAPAGSRNSLGEESVRDGRPSTDDSVEEAMDEEGPGISDAVE